LLILAPAAALACADLVVKATVATPWWAFHHRSDAWVALSVVLLFAALALSLVPSRLVALAAGVMCGGVVGNVVSARAHSDWVANPLTIGGYRQGIAFNLADVFFLVGNLALTAALVAVTLRNRERLLPPREWERSLRRRFRS